jgi:hypothetical protein
MSKYEAIGMNEWKALPNIFSDTEFAKTLDGNTNFCSYNYSIPSEVVPDKLFELYGGISYSKLTGLFTKYIGSMK